MLWTRALILELKTNKQSRLLWLLAIPLLISLTLLTYGLVLFSSSGRIDHGDHFHLSERFVLTTEELVTFVVASVVFALTVALFGLGCWKLLQGPKVDRTNIKLANSNPAPQAVVLQADCDHFQVGDHCVFSAEKQHFKQQFKQDFLGKSKFSFRNELYRFCLIGVLISLNLALSMVEIPGIVLPWGSSIQFRFFNTAILFIAIRFVGLLSTSLIAIITPWIHLLLHPVHTPISTVFYMGNDLVVLWIFYFFYYHIFKAEVKQTTTVVNNKEFSQLVNTHKTKVAKALALIPVNLICGFIEGLGFYVGYFLILGKFGSVGHKIFYDSQANRDLINSANVIYFLLTTTTIFSLKYLFELLFFYSVEKGILNISRHFGLY